MPFTDAHTFEPPLHLSDPPFQPPSHFYTPIVRSWSNGVRGGPIELLPLHYRPTLRGLIAEIHRIRHNGKLLIGPDQHIWALSAWCVWKPLGGVGVDVQPVYGNYGGDVIVRLTPENFKHMMQMMMLDCERVAGGIVAHVEWVHDGGSKRIEDETARELERMAWEERRARGIQQRVEEEKSRGQALDGLIKEIDEDTWSTDSSAGVWTPL